MDQATHGVQATANETRGDDACWLHLVCPSCGALATAEDGHREGCDARESRVNDRP